MTNFLSRASYLLKGRTPMLAASCLLLAISAPTVNAAVNAKNTLSSVLPKLMTIDHGILAAEYDAKSKKLAIWSAKTDWLPSVTFDGKYGNQIIRKEGGNAAGTNTNYAQNEEDIKLKQLVYDFGKTGAAIDKADLGYRQSVLSLLSTRQTAMNDGAKAYLDLLKAYKSLDFARRNEHNVADQVKMEEARRASGSGFRTDVLEAKAQLSGAKAKVTQAEGALGSAVNAYKKQFLNEPPKAATFILPPIPDNELPKTLKSAVKIAMAHNPDLLKEQYTVDIARQTIRDKRSAFAPSLDASYEAKYQYDMNGTEGKKQEYTAQLELSYPLFNSFGDVADYRAAVYDLSSAEEKLADKRLETEQSVRDDWESFVTSRANAEHLIKQSEQLATFLKLATKERQMGRKTLLEVLVADTNYVNALEDGIAAQVTVNKAAYGLLKDEGRLTLATFTHPGASALLNRTIRRTKEKARAAKAARSRALPNKPRRLAPAMRRGGPGPRPGVRRGPAPRSGNYRGPARPGARGPAPRSSGNYRGPARPRPSNYRGPARPGARGPVSKPRAGGPVRKSSVPAGKPPVTVKPQAAVTTSTKHAAVSTSSATVLAKKHMLNKKSTASVNHKVHETKTVASKRSTTVASTSAKQRSIKSSTTATKKSVMKKATMAKATSTPATIKTNGMVF